MSSQSLSKGSSRWGSFLQHVESRLDTILADDESKPSANSVNPSRHKPEALNTDSLVVPHRSASKSRENDRLQERLAKAVITRTTASTAKATDITTAFPQPTSPVVTSIINKDNDEAPQLDLESKPDVPKQFNEPAPVSSKESNSITTLDEVTATSGAGERGHDLLLASIQRAQEKTDSDKPVNDMHSPSKASGIHVAYTQPNSPHTDSYTHSSNLWQIDGSETQTKGSNNSVTQSREETRAYMEHIDTLQAKLRQLTKEASNVSKRAASDATAYSVEAQVATREHKWQEQLRRLEALLEAEREKNSDMRDEVSTAKIERELGDERQRARLRDLQEKLDREKDAAKVLENRLESYRIQAEEASSNNTKDTQSALLRQTEVLQSQYSIATQNWRGIESSLLSKIANIEKERDEVIRKENESRRRSREANVKLRRAEEELRQANKDSTELQGIVDNIKHVLLEREKAFEETQSELEATRLSLKEENIRANRLAKQLDELTPSHCEGSLTGPVITQHRAVADPSNHHLYSKHSADSVKHNGRPQPTKPTLGLGNGSTTHLDRPLSRRQSMQPSHTSGLISPFRQDSMLHLTHQNLNGHTPETPSIRTEHDDFLDGPATPITPDRTINDVISVSTTVAGPSVQLIERMSAAVRRLESEKASSQDELDRIMAQRDETRKQVMSLMQELEVRKEASDRVRVLEQEVASINQRYQTTLEMLGEKSELVEELRADVADVKQMYKDLIETTLC